MSKILSAAQGSENAAASREAVARGYGEVGFPMDKAESFEFGGTIATAKETLLYEKNGVGYSWGGALPKVVPAGSTPATTGGISPTAWIDQSAKLLRQQLTAMSGNLAPVASWANVPSFSDPELGGPLGPINAQAQALANRLEYVASNSYPLGTYVDLRAYSLGATRVDVLGVSTPLDGGAGLFVMDASDTTSVDNGGTIIVDALGRRWKRIIDAQILPQWFGGDPKGVLESSAAITACANAAKTAQLKANYAGRWNLNKTVIVGDEGNTTGSQRVSYTGAGRIIFSGSRSKAQVRVQSSILPINAEFGINAGSEAKPIVHNEFFVNQGYNNQGLAYYNGYYYVGYDLGGGNGMVERYNAAGVLDTSFGGVAIPINHAAEVAVRFSTGRVYVASGGGAEPTYIRELAVDGKSVSQSIDLTAYGNSALCAIDNQNDIIVLHSTLTGGDGGLPTFTFFNFGSYSSSIKQFTLSATLGVPQGMDVFEGTIYFYTNNKITLISYDGEIQGSFSFGVTGESEGMTVCSDYGNAYIAVGYNSPRRVMTIRSPHASAVRNVNFMGTANSNSDGHVSLAPTIIPFSIRKNTAAAGAGWALTTYGLADHPRFENLFLQPTIDSVNKWLVLKLRFDPIGSVFSANAQFALNTFGFTTWPLQVMCDVKGGTPSSLIIGFVDETGLKVDPATISGTGVIWGHAVVGVRYNIANY